jgi:hypothetical protein
MTPQQVLNTSAVAKNAPTDLLIGSSALFELSWVRRLAAAHDSKYEIMHLERN